MKKILTILLVVVLSMMTACDNGKEKGGKETSKTTENGGTAVTTKAIDNVVPINADKDNFSTYAVDENNNIYALADVPPDNLTMTLLTYDINNNREKSTVQLTGENMFTASCMTVSNGKIYYATTIQTPTGFENSISVIDLSTEEKKATKLISFPDYTDTTKIVALGDEIFIFGIKGSLVDKEYEICQPIDNIPMEFNYSGQAISSYNLKSNTMTDVPVELPIAFSLTKNNSLMIYAYDSIKGYHFVEYSDGTFSNKIYNRKFSNMHEFDIFNKENYFLIAGNKTLESSNVAENSIIATLLDHISINKIDGIHCTDEYGYYVEAVFGQEGEMPGKKINRVKISDLVKDKPPIKLISSAFFNGIPYGCGYQMDNQQLAEDGFALNIMSQSTDFDLCMVSSDQKFSDPMKTKGVFEPLNDIPAVVEYLDKCFPSAKEAAINEKGDIWMLPVELHVPAIVINKKNCEKEGLKFTNTMQVTDFLDIVETVKKKSELVNYYDANAYRFSENMIAQYIAAESTFETPLFRTLLPMLKNRVSGVGSKFTTNINLTIGLADWDNHGYRENLLFITTYNKDAQRRIKFSDKTLNAVPFPKLVENSKNSGLCSYLCVNPYSANKEAAMDYISDLATYMMEQQDSFVLSNPEMYTKSDYVTDLLAIYNDSKIHFALPGDIFAGNYSQYVYGLMDEDEFITEADRKWDAYRNE